MSLLNPNDEDEDSSTFSFASENTSYDPEAEAYTVLRLLNCPLCGRLFSDPVTYLCGNTFCRGCLLSHSTAFRFQCTVQGCGRLHGVDERTARTDVSVSKLTDICRKEIPELISRVTQQNTRTNSRYTQDEFDFLERHLCDDDANSSDEEESQFYSRRFDSSDIYSENKSNDNSNNSHVVRTDLSRLKDLLAGELECQVCYQLFIDPVTTPCGHTYCRPCLTRSLDHNDRCPLCRYQLRSYEYYRNNPINKTISTFITSLYPALYADRRQSAESELYDSMQDVPIFVTSLVFPRMPCFLHIFEPRYRLMIRRCLESRQRKFGMILQEDSEYGTMLEIRSSEFLDDGRSMVETIGTYRFRLVERGIRDGYIVGRVERIDDIDPEQELERERDAIRVADINNANPINPRTYEPTISELITIARDFIESLRNGYAPWLLQRLNSTYGDMPEDPSDFSFWIASVIPIEESEKYRLLGVRSIRERMKIIVSWIEQLRGQWWFSRGCSIS
ncbi:7270_t:CDS:1 [Acaulospora morrowiae]|uniref:7270_t:CDS:1 n=1 Tax=Acaulospora morrowiae TaxID=94023 RepID=A0A9N8W8V0_9GLOM|nr:7270_t:CDS:1 [Acaulospora morrowiae]